MFFQNLFLLLKCHGNGGNFVTPRERQILYSSLKHSKRMIQRSPGLSVLLQSLRKSWEPIWRPFVSTWRRGCLGSQPEGTRCKSCLNIPFPSVMKLLYFQMVGEVNAIHFTCRKAFSTVTSTSLITYWNVGVHMEGQVDDWKTDCNVGLKK